LAEGLLPAQASAPPAARLSKAEHLYRTRNQGDHAAQAIALYQAVLQDDPTNNEALWKLSRSFRWQGDEAASKKEKLVAYKKAEDYATQAISAHPKDASGHLMLGIAYGRIGETQGVLKSLFLVSPIKKEMQAVLKQEPDNDVAHHVLGVLYRKLPGWLGGSLKKSVRYLKKAVQENPHRLIHALDLAKTYLEQGEKKKAAQALVSLLATEKPEDPVQAKREQAEAKSLLASLQP